MIERKYEIEIEAPRNVVWRALWDDVFYRSWTSVFNAGSYATGDWKEGGEIQFLVPDGCGMYSIIEKMTEPENMDFVHIGEIKDGKKTPKEDWIGNFERYYLEANSNGTLLRVSANLNEQWTEYFDETFPRALQKLKDIAESAEALTVENEIEINAPLETVWRHFTDAKDIVNWNFASDDWHCPRAENDLSTGGRFNYRMETKDGAIGFDLTGSFVKIEKPQLLIYEFDDGRRVENRFAVSNGGTRLVQRFEIENINPVSLQKAGWLQILENFKKNCEE